MPQCEPAHIHLYRRALDYLGTAQIYLKANPVLEEPLRPEHVKTRLLGPGRTVPGIDVARGVDSDVMTSRRWS
jgi:xylulose-5-phosphate/fructose-6-phosphate phosphoketolase